MKKALSLVLALMLLVGCMSFAAAEETITLNVWHHKAAARNRSGYKV